MSTAGLHRYCYAVSTPSGVDRHGRTAYELIATLITEKDVRVVEQLNRSP